MFFMCIVIVCVDSLEDKLCSVCVLTEGALVHFRVGYVLYVY